MARKRSWLGRPDTSTPSAGPPLLPPLVSVRHLGCTPWTCCCSSGEPTSPTEAPSSEARGRCAPKSGPPAPAMLWCVSWLRWSLNLSCLKRPCNGALLRGCSGSPGGDAGTALLLRAGPRIVIRGIGLTSEHQEPAEVPEFGRKLLAVLRKAAFEATDGVHTCSPGTTRSIACSTFPVSGCTAPSLLCASAAALRRLSEAALCRPRWHSATQLL
mmetsp:Transcript_103614/g.260823  ORF Transcript_103614/g.260823 Transcript_103614/m.260823 type:complete len:214 (-) Transcript_103614:607-1248(-)